MPPAAEDELISSWLDRTARFHGLPIQALLAGIGTPRKPVELSEVDLGISGAALRPVATLLGVDVEQLAGHTIAAAYPRATGLVARGTFVPSGHRRPRLRCAACPQCLERQRAEHGISWLTRAWVLAPRTVCSLHHVPLVEGQVGGIVHPVWSDFLRRHQRSDRAVCTIAQSSSTPATTLAGRPAEGEAVALLHRQMAIIQDGILAEAARGQEHTCRMVGGGGAAAVAGDLVWAFTRADRHFPDRLVYEAFASDLLDSPWHMARRRRPGPIDFTGLPVDERYLLLATATMCVGPLALRRAFCRPPGHWQADLATLHRRLKDPDRAELAERQRRWDWVPGSTVSGSGTAPPAHSTL